MRLINIIPAVICAAMLAVNPLSSAAEQGRGRGQVKHADQGPKNKNKNKDKDKGNKGEERGDVERARFEGLDQNRDGIISRAEWRGDDQSFRTHDWNRDGIISGDELRAGAPRPDWINRYASWDSNHDNMLSAGEWRGSRADFLRLDTNRDGVLTRNELGIP